MIFRQVLEFTNELFIQKVIADFAAFVNRSRLRGIRKYRRGSGLEKLFENTETVAGSSECNVKEEVLSNGQLTPVNRKRNAEPDSGSPSESRNGCDMSLVGLF